MLGLLLAAALTIATWSGDAPRSDWTARVNAAHTAVQFEYRYAESDEHGNWNEVNSREYSPDEFASAFQGVSLDRLLTDGEHLHFRSRRDPGTLEFDGITRSGTASGTFSIVLDPAFAAALQRRGMGAPTQRQQRELVMLGGTYAYLDLLAAQGFERPDAGQFLRLLEHGVSAGYLKGMGALRLTSRSIDAIVRARDHGVTPAYAEGFAAAGYGSLSINDLIRLRDHGVSPEYVQGLRKRGYANRLTVDDLIKLRDHGI